MDFLKKIFPFIILLSCLVSAKPLYAIETLDRIVAVVNNHVITQQQLSEQIEMTRQQWLSENKPIPDSANFRKQVLNQMIDNELQLQLAASSGLKINEAALDKTIMDIARRNGFTLEQLKGKLQQENIPYAKYRQQIRQQLIINRLQQDEVAAKINVTDQETKDMLAHMPKSAPQKTAYHVEDLLIPFPNKPSAADISRIKETALSLLQQTKHGVSFQELIGKAKQFNPPLSGGDLGWRALNDLPDIFQASVQKLKPGEVTGPIQADNGFHLIRLLEMHGDNSTAHYVTSTHTRHILIKTSPLLNNTQAERRLNEIRADILRGGDFATLAKKYSQDPGSAYKGGDLGWTLPGLFDPTFEAQIKKLTINQISLPFQTQFGWHIVQVLGRAQKLQTMQNVSREQAAQLVYQRKFQQALKNWLRQIRNQSYVKIL
ncbi:peptidylprolyl isomerase [Rickettsiella endosymbiont of Miltochrista miniata]|uniref:peptidylprolyl isomerase n=1 Tax=Rickettsiella endosymbiont of Miltochrista miniata TaxID=3066239 RepID=UPI00313DF53D